jgi:hypothetical protein
MHFEHPFCHAKPHTLLSVRHTTGCRCRACRCSTCLLSTTSRCRSILGTSGPSRMIRMGATPHREATLATRAEGDRLCVAAELPEPAAEFRVWASLTGEQASGVRSQHFFSPRYTQDHNTFHQRGSCAQDSFT